MLPLVEIMKLRRSIGLTLIMAGLIQKKQFFLDWRQNSTEKLHLNLYFAPSDASRIASLKGDSKLKLLANLMMENYNTYKKKFIELKLYLQKIF
jgi:hypothetical protein